MHLKTNHLCIELPKLAVAVTVAVAEAMPAAEAVWQL